MTVLDIAVVEAYSGKSFTCNGSRTQLRLLTFFDLLGLRNADFTKPNKDEWMKTLNVILRNLARLLMILAAHTPVCSQLVDRPVERFEFISWTDKPVDLKANFGYSWFRFGRMIPLWVEAPIGDSLMSFSGADTAFGFRINLVFTLTHRDSSLVALTLLCIPHNLKGDVNEQLNEFEETIQKVYGEPQSSLSVPLVAKTLVWNMKRSTVRLVRMRALVDALTLMYKPLKPDVNSVKK